MKITFIRNGGFSDSPYYNYLLNYPASGVKYILPQRNNDVVVKNFLCLNGLKTLAKIFLTLSNKSYIKTIKIASDRDNLIHAFNVIPITNRKYIIELEAMHSLFMGTVDYKPAIKKVINYLEKPNCKKILFWTQVAMDGFNTLMKSDIIKNKCVVLYPAVIGQKRKNKLHKKPTIGFIGRDFTQKGGPLAAIVMNDFINAGKANGLIVTGTLTETNRKKLNKNIKILPLCSRKELYKTIFPEIDIMLYPGYSDTFGFMFPEAASFGIPIVTYNGVARYELVHHKKSGFVAGGTVSKRGYPNYSIEEEYLNEHALGFEMVITNILSDKKTWKSMSKYSYDMVVSPDGMYSMWGRNKKLKKIYKNATKH